MKLLSSIPIRQRTLPMLCMIALASLIAPALPAGQIVKQVVTLTIAASGTTATSADFTAVPGIIRSACSDVGTTATITIQTSNAPGTTAIPVKADTVTASGEIDGFAATAVSGTTNIKVVLSGAATPAKTVTIVLFTETE